MALPASREDLINYCLHNLGAPVIEINVAREQIEDRVDEAVQVFNTYHMDGSERFYLKHEITQDDMDNGYIEVDDAVLSVLKVFPYSAAFSTNNIFSIRYQMAINDLFDFSSIDLSYYEVAKQHINLLDDMLVGTPSIRFNVHTNRVYIDTNWITQYGGPGTFLLFECFLALDGGEYSKVWNDEFLKRYTTALIKKQWGSNLKKMIGLSLMGGTSVNADAIYSEAVEEIEQLHEDLKNKYSYPPMFFMR